MYWRRGSEVSRDFSRLLKKSTDVLDVGSCHVDSGGEVCSQGGHSWAHVVMAGETRRGVSSWCQAGGGYGGKSVAGEGIKGKGRGCEQAFQVMKVPCACYGCSILVTPFAVRLKDFKCWQEEDEQPCRTLALVTWPFDRDHIEGGG